MCTNETGARLQPLAPTAMLSYPFGALKQLNEAAAVAAAVNTGTSAVLPPPQSQLATSAGPLVPSSPTNATAVATATTLDHYRLQFYNYAVAERLRYTQQAFFANPYNPPNTSSLSAVPHPLHLGRAQDFTHLFLPYAGKIDPRFYLRPQEEPKPQYSYIGLIAMAILSSPDKKLVLSDIYQYILDNYSYFRTRGPGWRNSIRHNLSLNDCFIKAGRSANGKGHYWAIHPANIDDFTKGDFRRRKAQRKVRKSMGLSVDEEDSPTPPSSPVTPHPGLSWPGPHQLPHRHPGDLSILPGMASHHHHANKPMNPHETSLPLLMLASSAAAAVAAAGMPTMTSLSPSSHSDPENPRKRLFDMASLLAPDDRSITPSSPARADSSLASTSGHRGDSVPEEDDEGVLPTPSPNKRRKMEEEEVDVVSDDFSHVPGHDKEADHNSEDDTWSKGLETATPTTAFTTDAKGQEMPLLQADQILATDARDAFQALLMERQQRLSSLNGSATPSNWRANTPCSTPYPLFPNPSFQMARPLAGVNLSRYPTGTSVLPPSTVNNPQAIFASPIEQLNKYYEQLAETVRLNLLNQKEK